MNPASPSVPRPEVIIVRGGVCNRGPRISFLRMPFRRSIRIQYGLCFYAAVVESAFGSATAPPSLPVSARETTTTFATVCLASLVTLGTKNVHLTPVTHSQGLCTVPSSLALPCPSFLSVKNVSRQGIFRSASPFTMFVVHGGDAASWGWGFVG